MNFKEMCERYVVMSKKVYQVRARRRIWPPSVSVLLVYNANVFPMVSVRNNEDDGTVRFSQLGMNLEVKGESVILSWCPSIDDVLGQDWLFIEGDK